MDQIKTGRFIAERRKAVGLTQMQLAEKLNITDRAVSKWETGRAMPDSSIMLELCDILKITVNDLLCGEVVTVDNYNKELEKNLLEMIKQKEQSDKRLLRMEIVVAVATLLPLLISTIIIIIIPMEEWLATIIELASMVPFLIAVPFLLKIEQTAGYYECQECSHRYVPTYKRVFLARHIGRTRKMKCPSCGKKAWHKKVISKQ